MGSVGIPVQGTEVKIVDLENGTKELAAGEEGELILKGPQVMKGYWKKPKETSRAIRNGWLYTGDIAKKDEDGYYYIVGRKKDMIIAGGLNIYRLKWKKCFINIRPLLKLAFGVPDNYLGEKLLAVSY